MTAWIQKCVDQHGGILDECGCGVEINWMFKLRQRVSGVARKLQGSEA